MKTSDISKKAKKVKEDYGLYGTAIDPIIIAEENGINIIQKSNLNIKGEPVSGAIIKSGSDITIYVNANDNKNRKRFTIAHELAHFFLHLDKDKELVDFKRDDSKNPIELEADEFAGCLLMDEALVEEWYNKTNSIGLSNERVIDIMSQIFVVSSPAMYKRLRKLGLLNNER